MKSLMLAAGLARRLYGDENTELPKALLTFGEKARCLDTLAHLENVG